MNFNRKSRKHYTQLKSADKNRHKFVTLAVLIPLIFRNILRLFVPKFPSFFLHTFRFLNFTYDIYINAFPWWSFGTQFCWCTWPVKISCQSALSLCSFRGHYMIFLVLTWLLAGLSYRLWLFRSLYGTLGLDNKTTSPDTMFYVNILFLRRWTEHL